MRAVSVQHPIRDGEDFSTRFSNGHLVNVRTNSYPLWLLVFMVPALVVGVVNDSVVAASLTAVVLAGLAYLYFNYPF